MCSTTIPAAGATEAGELELTILMPCLNEAETVATCVRKALGFLAAHQVSGEVLVVDNGSTDGSPDLASEAGARVVHVVERGYGRALLGGFAAARGKFIIMGDADDSYDFTALEPFLRKLRDGYDLVMGNRFAGGIAPGAMPALHRWLGNPVLTGIGRLLFHAPVRDFHCGLRGFSKAAVQRMNLQTVGMELASEIVLKACVLQMRIAEVPTTLSRAGRSRPPHLRSWRDGWRHLRFMLIYSPRWLFLYPGLVLMGVGAAVGLWLLPGPRAVGRVTLDVHTLLYAALAVLIGFQAVFFALFTKVFAETEQLLPPDPRLARLARWLTLEVGLGIGFGLVALGVGGSVFAVRTWLEVSFGPLEPRAVLRMIIPSILALTLGCQIVLGSFFLSVLRLPRRRGAAS
jgi:glycosyltransferase involved in cell wall biosynthesis